jgi:hypothetical protein
MLRFTNYFISQQLTHDILQGIRGGIIDTLRRGWWWSWLLLGFRFELHTLLCTFGRTTLNRGWRRWFGRSNIEFLLPISAAFKWE